MQPTCVDMKLLCDQKILTGTNERKRTFTLHRVETHNCNTRKSRIQRIHGRVFVKWGNCT